MKTHSHASSRKSPQQWIRYLERQSGFQDEEIDLGLVQQACQSGNEPLFREWIQVSESKAPPNSPGEFVAMCGAAGLGRLVAQGKTEYYATLRKLSNDPRERVRMGVVIAIQEIGKRDFEGLMGELNTWKRGTVLERQVAVAGLCAPSLWKEETPVLATLLFLKDVIDSIPSLEQHPACPSFGSLRTELVRGLGLIIAARPALGEPLFEAMRRRTDPYIRSILEETLNESSLKQTDPVWTRRMGRSLAAMQFPSSVNGGNLASPH